MDDNLKWASQLNKFLIKTVVLFWSLHNIIQNIKSSSEINSLCFTSKVYHEILFYRLGPLLGKRYRKFTKVQQIAARFVFFYDYNQTSRVTSILSQRY